MTSSRVKIFPLPLGTAILLSLLLLLSPRPLSSQNSSPPSPDFDGNGVVDIPDFLLFVDVFGTKESEEKYESKYDLDGNGEIGISDFLIFVDSFGKVVNRGTTNSFTHESTFDRLPADNFRIVESYYHERIRWYMINYDFAKYSGYQELLEKFDYHLPTGKGLTILQAESGHTPDDIGDVKHLFKYEDSTTHSEDVAGILSEVAVSIESYIRGTRHSRSIWTAFTQQTLQT